MQPHEPSNKHIIRQRSFYSGEKSSCQDSKANTGREERDLFSTTTTLLYKETKDIPSELKSDLTLHQHSRPSLIQIALDTELGVFKTTEH